MSSLVFTFQTILSYSHNRPITPRLLRRFNIIFMTMPKQNVWVAIGAIATLFSMVLILLGNPTICDIEATEDAKFFYDKFFREVKDTLDTEREDYDKIIVPESIKEIRVVNNTVIVIEYRGGTFGICTGKFEPVDLAKYNPKVIKVMVKDFAGPGEYTIRTVLYGSGEFIIEFQRE